MTLTKWTGVTLVGLTALACSGSDRRPSGSGGIDETSSDETSSGSLSDSATDSTPAPDAAGGGSEDDAPDAGDMPLDASALEAGASQLPDAGPPPPVTGRYDAGRFEPSDAATDVATPCTGNRAFLSMGGAFVHPTPSELAHVLNQDIYNGGAMTIVLQTTDAGPRLAASYTVDTVNGHTFTELRPEFVAGAVSAAGFASVETQAEGWMLLERETGPVELPLANISLQATTTDNCLRAFVTLSAIIPGEYLDRVIEGTGNEADAGEGRGAGEPGDTSVRVLLETELVTFDFPSEL